MDKYDIASYVLAMGGGFVISYIWGLAAFVPWLAGLVVGMFIGFVIGFKS